MAEPKSVFNRPELPKLPSDADVLAALNAIDSLSDEDAQAELNTALEHLKLWQDVVADRANAVQQGAPHPVNDFYRWSRVTANVPHLLFRRYLDTPDVMAVQWERFLAERLTAKLSGLDIPLPSEEDKEGS